MVLGAWFSGLVAPAIDRFADPTLGPALAFLILCAGAVFAVYILARTSVITWHLGGIAKVLRGLPDKEAFAERFAVADAALGRRRLTRHGWLELKDSFVEVAGAGRGVYRNTVRPARYINRHEVDLHFRLEQSVPNVFVGVGLFFTFVGLVAALKQANTGIAGADVTATTAALAGLLAAATAKFYTSIAGLGCSILLGFLVRTCLGSIDRRFTRIAHLLEERLVLVTPEDLTARLLAEAREQTEQLKLINTDVAIAIGERVRVALDDALPRHLAAAAAPLGERVAAMIDAVSTQSRDGVGEMVKAFSERLDGEAQGRMGDLATTLERLVATLEATVQRMSQGGDGLGEALRGAAGQLAATVETVRDSVAGLAQQMRDEGEAGQARVTKQLEEVHHAMTLMASRMTQAVEEGAARARHGAGEAADALVAQVAGAAEKLAAVGGGIEAAIGAASQRAQAAVRDTAADTARQLGTAGAEAVMQFRAAVDELGGRVGGLGEELARTTAGLRELERHLGGHARAIAEAEGGTKAVAGALGETAVRIRTAATEAGDGLRGATQPLLAVGERLAIATETARRSNEALAGALTETAAHAKQQAEASRRTLEQLEAVWNRHVARFDGVDEQLGRAFDEIGAKLRENLGHLARFSAEIDQHTAKAVGHFAGAVEELAEVGTEIGKGVQALNGHAAARRP